MQGTTNCSFRPPRKSRMQATSHIPGLDNQPSCAVGATVLRGLRDSQSEPLLAMHISTFTPSTSSRTSPCRWTCDWAWDRREHSTTLRQRHPHSLWVLPRGGSTTQAESGLRSAAGTRRSCLSLAARHGRENVVRCVLTDDTKLAVQHRPRREDERREADGIGHQNDELLRHQPAHVAHRQPDAVLEEPEEQRVDLLQVVSEPNLSWSNACLNFHHFDSQSAGHLERVIATTTVHPRLFKISIPLTFRAGYLKRVIDTVTVYPRLFEISPL